jgi:hypothetical protein
MNSEKQFNHLRRKDFDLSQSEQRTKTERVRDDAKYNLMKYFKECELCTKGNGKSIVKCFLRERHDELVFQEDHFACNEKKWFEGSRKEAQITVS